MKRQYTLGETNVGTGQFVDIFQRASFWDQTKPDGINPNYHVNLSPRVLPKFDLTFSGTVQKAPCGKLALIDMNALIAQLLAQIPAFSAAGVSSTTFPILLLKDVAFYQGTVSNCCVLGFHAAIPNPIDGGIQTFAVAGFDSSHAFRSNRDIGVITHEVGEWMDDPLGTNPTPPWGHIGQVSGCQANLEVGDPLTGTAMTSTVTAGTFHPQEMAFFSWFYGLAPSTGVNGWYSMNGTFTTPAEPCI